MYKCSIIIYLHYGIDINIPILGKSFKMHLRLVCEMREDLLFLRIKHIGRDYADRVQGMAKDSEVGQ